MSEKNKTNSFGSFLRALKRVDDFKSENEEGITDKYVAVVTQVFILEESSPQLAFERVYDDLVPARIDGDENWNQDSVEIKVYDFSTGRWIGFETWRGKNVEL